MLKAGMNELDEAKSILLRRYCEGLKEKQ